MNKKIVFSGIQPTGKVHIGNYLGAIRHWVYMQDAYDSIFCIVNSHAITINQKPSVLVEQTIDLACMLIACGIDCNKSKLFIQSDIDEHPALAWIFDCNIQMGDMSRMTQFKDKSKKNEKNINVGLFNYPALMAADILLYDTDLVPVGEDQKQHIELTRDIAIKFNRDYGLCFKIPEPLISSSCARIMGLDNPLIKMSKSNTNKGHAIFMLDSNDDIMKSIKKAVTDSYTDIVFDKTRPGIYNLLSIYEILSNKNREDIEIEFMGKSYGYFKNVLIDLLIDAISPIRNKYNDLQNDKQYVLDILKRSADSIRPKARETYNRVKKMVGLL